MSRQRRKRLDPAAIVNRNENAAGTTETASSGSLLRRRYAALKRAIMAGGPIDPVAFTKAKHDWIVAALDQLGLGSHQHDRLYEVLQAGRTVAAVP